MQDRPDLIESELSGLAFDSCQQLFRSADLEIMFTQPCPDLVVNEDVFMVIDPAAGGPQSNYAVLTATRYKGMLTVSLPVWFVVLVLPVQSVESIVLVLLAQTQVRPGRGRDDPRGEAQLPDGLLGPLPVVHEAEVLSLIHI